MLPTPENVIHYSYCLRISTGMNFPFQCFMKYLSPLAKHKIRLKPIA